jgi:hypothetical protein
MNSVDRRTAYRFFRATSDAGLDSCILALANYLTLPEEEKEDGRWTQLLDVTAQLYECYFYHYETTIHPNPLIDGNDLMEILSMSPGPEIGRILKLIEEEQAAGDVETREQALNLARKEASMN